MSSDRFSIGSEKSIGEVLQSASEFLSEHNCYYGHGTDNAWDEVVALFLHLSSIHTSGVNAETDPEILLKPFDDRLVSPFQCAVTKRAIEKLPMPYITGIAWFCGQKFHVNRHTLIPRSPIAELIQSDFRPWVVKRPERILDLCCGSGCIGIAAALVDDSVHVVLSDISAQALLVAEQNIQQHAVSERVTTVCGDLYANIERDLEENLFDLILCNPPYVDAEDIRSMPAEYHHEPLSALASGDEGLDLTHEILRQSAGHLTDSGCLILEVGNSWEHLSEAYPQVPFTWVEFARGGHGVCVLTKKELEAHWGSAQ